MLAAWLAWPALLALLLLPCAAALAADGARAAAVAVPDTMAQRALACTGCHGPQGRSSPQGYIPRIAGKPAGYLLAQMQGFRDGRRRHEVMAGLFGTLTDGYLRELAAHFAALEVPYAAPPRSVDEGASPRRAEQLVRQGDTARQLPACVSCHGHALTGVVPAVPGLVGLPRDYIAAQLGAWREGVRRAPAPDCMAQIAQRLAPPDIAALADWLTAQPPPATPATAAPASAPPATWPLQCAGVVAR